MARRKKKEVSLKSMTFYCGYIEREVVVPSDELEFESWENPGSHGCSYVSFGCECSRKSHCVVLDEW